jgi:hypothetical protein
LALVDNRQTWQAFSLLARERALARSQREPAVDRYEAIYRRVLSA